LWVVLHPGKKPDDKLPSSLINLVKGLKVEASFVGEGEQPDRKFNIHTDNNLKEVISYMVCKD